MPPKTLTSPFARPRWTEQDARDALAALQRSGKSVRGFALEQGLDPQRLYSWKRRLGGYAFSAIRSGSGLVVTLPSSRDAQ